MKKEEIEFALRYWRENYEKPISWYRMMMPELTQAMATEGLDSWHNRQALREPLLTALLELGGRPRRADVLDVLTHKLGEYLTSYDWTELDDGEIRWKKEASFARENLLREGLISGAQHGIWELTDKGKAEAERIKEG